MFDTCVFFLNVSNGLNFYHGHAPLERILGSSGAAPWAPNQQATSQSWEKGAETCETGFLLHPLSQSAHIPCVMLKLDAPARGAVWGQTLYTSYKSLGYQQPLVNIWTILPTSRSSKYLHHAGLLAVS